MRTRVSVQEAPFDLGAEYLAVADAAEVGGIGCFIGQVRGGEDLVALRLEHYPAMTQHALTAIIGTAEARFDLVACTVIHRFGRLEVGEPIVLVLAASAHRQAALDATRFLIDWLKTDAPFWKCAEFADGRQCWVAAHAADDATRAAWDAGPSSRSSG
jgi:molybdopterin synthase catalytic subunit